VKVHARIGGALGRLPLGEQAARRCVGVEEVVSGLGERLGIIGDGGVEPCFVHDLGEGGIDVEIVLREGAFDAPRQGTEISFEERASRAEFEGRAGGDADHLAGPAAADLVLQDRERKAPQVREALRGLAAGCAGRIGTVTTGGGEQANEEQHGPAEGRAVSHAESLRTAHRRAQRWASGPSESRQRR
jgi:hypothetical protein